MAEKIVAPAQLPVAMPRAVLDPVPRRLPSILRVQSIERHPAPEGHILARAVLFHESASLNVEWLARQVDVRIVQGCLVSVRWLGNPTSTDGRVRIARLAMMEHPDPDTDLFQLVPTAWVKERDLVKQASQLWQRLPVGFRHLFNAIFWDGKRFQRYLMGPGSLEHHHNRINGNFRHSLDVAGLAQAMGRSHADVCEPILVLGALIHDAGKADEYRFDRLRHRFQMSDQGDLIGHRDRLQHWLAAAMAKHGITIPEAHYLGLIHSLTATKGAPAYLGLRESRTLEATILSMADRLSGERDLFNQSRTEGGGFGKYCRYLRGRPFIVGTESLVRDHLPKLTR